MRRTVSSATPTPPVAPWRWAGAGAAVGLLLALLLFAPARWLASAVASASAGQVHLADPRGTVWDGSAQLVLTGGAGSRDQTALPERLSWHIRPGWGLSGPAIRTVWQAQCCMAQPLQAALAPRWAGLQLMLSDASAALPAALLAGLGTPWNTLQPEGVLRLSTRAMAIEVNAGRLQMSGLALLEAEAISSRLSTVKPMGSYRVTMTGGQTLRLKLETLANSPLQLSGNGEWVGGRLRFRGEATSAPDNLNALSNLLNILGRREGDRSILQVG
ncbi:type II secretion system protein N [Variovorax sp. HJSM1_2]|uniref:type II secretion system protein N n=1 Tax=Variovorax sp. HJSM1_2 TaxID=3366263 RepID=UPI003BC69F86